MHPAPLAGLPHAVFDHLGVVVKNLDKGRQSLVRTFNVCAWTQPWHDTVNGVDAIFGRDPGGMVYELITPLDDGSPVAGALRERRALLNHVAYRVPDLDAAARHLLTAGCAPTADRKPGIAFGNRDIQFFVTPLNIIIELIEAVDHVHDFRPVALATP